MIQFVVPAVPIAQPRQRHRVVSAGGRTFAQNYTPKNDPVNGFKAAVQLAASTAYRGPPLREPLIVSLVFVFPRKAALVWKTKPMPRLPHTSKPDRDNVMKSLQDALNGLLWHDDSVIFAGPVEKWIAAGDEQPHVEVTIEQYTELT